MSSDVVGVRAEYISLEVSMPLNDMARPTISVTFKSVVTLSAMVDTAPDIETGSSCRTFLAIAVKIMRWLAAR